LCDFCLSNNTGLNEGWSKFSVDLTLRVQTQCIPTISTQLKSWRWISQNSFGMWTVLYWTRSSRTQFGVSINVWRLAGENLNITCKFLYCKHHVHWDFSITLYINIRRLEILLGLITVKPRYNVKTFIAHTTLWKENTSFTLSRFTAANYSGKTVDIGNSRDIKCDAACEADVTVLYLKREYMAGKVVFKFIVRVQPEVPRSTICPL